MTTLSIPEMNCRHCEASVVAALTPLSGAVRVDLANRTAVLTASADPDALIAALARIGFDAAVVAA